MSYTVQFVGLVCFLRDHSGRKVLLPDGSSGYKGVEAHQGKIYVASNAVEAAQGWPDAAAVKRGEFLLDQPCTISLPAVGQAGSFETSQHDGKLPELRKMKPEFVIDVDKAHTIARLDIRQGKLRAFRIPGGTAAISQLDVAHDGPIEVLVTLDSGATRSIRLKPGTEIAITNAAHEYRSVDEENGHFRIYEMLSANPVTLEEPLSISNENLPPSQSKHIYFAGINPIGLSTSCSNTGCCAP